MSSRKSIETEFGKLRLFEKSIRIDGISETVFLGHDPSPHITEIVGFLQKIYQKGRQHKAAEIRYALKTD